MWKRSSNCDSNACVEVGFHKAEVSSGNNGDKVLVRDSKDKDGPVLTFTKAEWSAFLHGVKNQEFEV